MAEEGSRVGDATGRAAGARSSKPLRPSQCREYMRRELAREFPSIVGGFIRGAKRGSCQHVKLATELLAPRTRVKRSRKGAATLQQLVQEMEQIRD